MTEDREGCDFILGVGYLAQLTSQRITKKKHPIGFALPKEQEMAGKPDPKPIKKPKPKKGY